MSRKMNKLIESMVDFIDTHPDASFADIKRAFMQTKWMDLATALTALMDGGVVEGQFRIRRPKK